MKEKQVTKPGRQKKLGKFFGFNQIYQIILPLCSLSLCNINGRFSLHRSSKPAVESESSELSISEKNKAIEDGQNNNVQPAAYLSG